MMNHQLYLKIRAKAEKRITEKRAAVQKIIETLQEANIPFTFGRDETRVAG